MIGEDDGEDRRHDHRADAATPRNDDTHHPEEQAVQPAEGVSQEPSKGDGDQRHRDGFGIAPQRTQLMCTGIRCSSLTTDVDPRSSSARAQHAHRYNMMYAESLIRYLRRPRLIDIGASLPLVEQVCLTPRRLGVFMQMWPSRRHRDRRPPTPARRRGSPRCARKSRSNRACMERYSGREHDGPPMSGSALHQSRGSAPTGTRSSRCWTCMSSAGSGVPPRRRRACRRRLDAITSVATATRTSPLAGHRR